MPPGFARTAVAEEAVRSADAANDLDAGFEARMALAEVAQHGGEARKALVAVTWCLGQIDAHPGRFETHGPYWALKWLPWTLMDIPDVPLDEVERVVGEMRRRYEAEGTGQDAVAKMAWTLPLYLGRIEEAVEAHRRWRLLPRTEYGDCRACDVHSEVELALAAGDTARALDLARPALAGRLECAEEPAGILGRLLGPLADLRDLAEAERLHQWGLRLARGNPSLLDTQARHVVHLVRTGRLGDGEALLAELVDVCDHTVIDAGSRMWVAAAGACLASALEAAGVHEAQRSFGVRPRGTGPLAESFAQEARTTAAAFDRRNGTSAVSDEVETWLAVRAGAASHHAPPGTSTAGVAGPTVVPAAIAPPQETDDPDEVLTRARKQPALTDEARVSLAERALTGFLAAGDASGAARARRTIGAALVRTGREDDGERVLREALPDLAAHPDEQVWAALDLARLAFGRAEGRIDDEVRRLHSVALAAAERAPDRTSTLALCHSARAEWSVIELGPDAAPEQVAEAARAFAGARDLVADAPAELAHVWGGEASCRAVVGDLEGALVAATAAWDIARATGDDETVAQVGSLTSGLLASVGQPERALDVLATVQRAELARGERLDAADTAVARSELLRDADREEEALALAWEAVDLYASVGDAVGASGARLTVARLLRAMGQDLNAYDILSELAALAGGGDDRRFEGAVALDLAMLNAEYGDADEAMSSVQRALACFDADDAHARGRSHRVLADVHLMREEIAEALVAGDAAVRELATEDDPVLLADVRREQANRLVVAGRAEDGLALFALAREAYDAHGLAVAAAGADLGRADALASMGRNGEAVAVAEQAAAVGAREDVPALVADAFWTAASHSAPDPERYERALDAYARAGAPQEQLDELRSAADVALNGKRRRFRFGR